MRRRGSKTDGAAERWMRTRFNPWQGMTPEMLARAFDEFDAGWIRRASLMWENRAERDEVLAAAVPKRCSSVARLPWSILPVDDSPRASLHVQALEDFFDRGVEATDALDLDQRGGMRLLIEQMMDAVFTGKAVHELVWRPGRNDLGVELRAVPLYFFEQLSGRLRYTGPEMTVRGEELEPGGWMVTSRRRRLMKACLFCCLFKSLSLSDWITYSEHFGMPGIHGEIDAAPDSPEWAKFEEALAAFAAEWVAATRSGAKINLIETSKNPNAPYEPMVERMSRMLVVLCRGADLGTLSSQDGAGASLQGDESDLLLEDDCQMVSESLQRHLARPVIRHLFGEEPLAYIEIQVPSDPDTSREIEVDDAMERWGIVQDPATLAERYGRTMIPAGSPATDDELTSAANDAAGESDEAVLGALAEVLRRAVSDRARKRLYLAIREALAGGGDLAGELARIQARLPEFLGPDPDAEAAFERFSAAAMLSGWSEAAGRPAMPMQIHANRPEASPRGKALENDRGASESTEEGFFAKVSKLLANARWSTRHPKGTPRAGAVAGGRFAKGARERRTKASRDAFGPKYRVGMSPAESEERLAAVIAKAIKDQRGIDGAAWREGLGRIDIPWGTPGDRRNDFKGGSGLSHILAKHGGADARRLPAVLAHGTVEAHPEGPRKRRIDHGGYLAILAKEQASSAWVLTAYSKR